MPKDTKMVRKLLLAFKKTELSLLNVSNICAEMHNPALARELQVIASAIHSRRQALEDLLRLQKD